MLPTPLSAALSSLGQSHPTTKSQSPADRPVDLAAHSDTARADAPAGERPSRAFLRVLDLMIEGVLLLDGTGAPLYRNPSLEHTLLDDADRAVLLREMRHVGLAIPRAAASRSADVAPAPDAVTTRETRTSIARYRIRAAAVDPALTGVERASLVTLERLTPVMPSPLALADRFNLTASEAGVASLLAQGHSNDAIARLLDISPHTARHHTENVLLKLNVHSRAEVGGKVFGTRRPSGPTKSV